MLRVLRVLLLNAPLHRHGNDWEGVGRYTL